MHDIENVLANIFPTTTTRKYYLSIVCEIIYYANSLGSEKWGLSIKDNQIRIKIGSLITAVVDNNSIWLTLDKDKLKHNSDEMNTLLNSNWDNGKWAEYSAIETRNYFLRDNSKVNWEKIKHLHFSAIDKAALRYQQLEVQSQKNNSQELLNYLKDALEPNLPFPKYKTLPITGDAKFIDTGYWVFLCNPKYWQVDEFLESDEVNSTWIITDWQKGYFKKGQYALIRVGADSRTKKELSGKNKLKAGIYGIVQIMSQPKPMADSDKKYWLQPQKYGEKRLRVKVKCVKKLLDNPILLTDLKNLTSFQHQKTLLNGRQASSWSISKNIFEEIIELAESNYKIIDEAINTELDNYIDLINLEAKYFNATPRVKEIVSKRIERGNISKAIKKVNNYECQICKALKLNPHGFKKKDGSFYVETHHIVPVSELEQGSLGTINLLTVCPNHHRQLHYGNVKLIKNNNNKFIFSIDNETITITKNTLHN